jgi:branched-chain amino acid transport system permease protein
VTSEDVREQPASRPTERPVRPVAEPGVVGGLLRRAATAASPTPRRPGARRGLLGQPLVRHLVLAIGGLAIIYVITQSVSSFDNFQIAQIGAYVVAVAGLSVLTGLNGQISLGHGAVMGIGAYAAALLMLHTGFPLLVVLLLAPAAAGLAGLVIGLGAARLRGPYLAGATLALAVGLPGVPYRWPGALGGGTGLSITQPTPPSFLGSNFDPQEWIAWICALAAVITLVILANLIRSRFGRSFRTVRDDEIVASLAGIHVARTQVLAFVVSAACAGLGGALLALSTGTVNPLGFPLSLSIALVAAAVVGGLGSLTGAIWGGILVVYLPQWATSVSNDFGFSKAVSSNLAFGFYGLVLIVVMLTFPGGIQGGVRRLWNALRALVARRSSPAAAGLHGNGPGQGAASAAADPAPHEMGEQ